MMQVEEISDLVLRRKMSRLVRSLLVSPVEFDTAALRNRGWIACPFELISLMDSSLAEQVDLTFNNRSQGEGILAVAADLGMPTSCFRIRGGPQVIEQWAVEHSWSSWVLFPEILTAALLCTMENFNVIAGPRDIVEAVLDMTVEEGCKEFLKFADRMPSIVEKSSLQEQAHRYCSF